MGGLERPAREFDFIGSGHVRRMISFIAARAPDDICHRLPSRGEGAAKYWPNCFSPA
jgi:hypothetical protein